ncbi:protein BUD31 homolog [Caerostris darwini]|uniref:Protein BUD31 homolog n=1 Tax=Caerostris darwini TaxID=1538125 RepID=A0AAV4QR30_9ARAC|nr:protein BUD31 homolog [Caerostris darwini]
MPKVRRSRHRPPDGWDLIESTIEELEQKMREAETEPHDGKRKVESLWPIFRIHHQKSRYVYDLYYRRKAISKELYDYCIKENIADKNLIAKWKKQGYENLCCLRCIQARDTNFGTNCICRVPKSKLEEGKIVECVHCGCRANHRPGPPDLTSPESPPLFEQGIPPDPAAANINKDAEIKMDTSQTVTAEQLSCNDFLFGHPAPTRLSDPTPEPLLYFEVLLKEAAAVMVKVSKHQSAANNIKSPTWERASLTIEDCSKRIRAICTYTGIPASHLPIRKELLEIKKAKELQLQLAAEAAAKEATPPPPAPTIPEQPNSTETSEQPISSKRKSPTSDDDEEGFQKVVSKKDRKRKDRPIKVVLRGLPGHTPIEDVETELRALEFPLIKIARMSKFRTREPMPLIYLHPRKLRRYIA